MIVLSITKNQKVTKVPLDVDLGLDNLDRNKYGLLYDTDRALSLSESNNVLYCNMDHEEFGVSMSYLRGAKNLTQIDLAKMADVTPQYISMMENGKKKPKINTFCEILRVIFKYTERKKGTISSESKTADLLSSLNKVPHINLSGEIKEKRESLQTSIVQLLSQYNNEIDNIFFWALVEETLTSYYEYCKCVDNGEFMDNNARQEAFNVVLEKISMGLKTLGFNVLYEGI